MKKSINSKAGDASKENSDHQINTDFLTNEDIPNELKERVLNYLTFIELAKYEREVSKGIENEIVRNLIIKVFNEKKEIYLKKLTYKPSLPINVFRVVSEIISKEFFSQNDLSECLIDYSCYLDPQSAERILSKYLILVCKPDTNTIGIFLRYCSVIPARGKWYKRVVYIEGMGWGEDDTVVEMKQWSTLVGALLSNNPLIPKLIVSNYPKHIPDVMSALNELHKISTKYPRNCYYSLDEITTARRTLLLQLKQKHSGYYTLTYADKRLIEGHLSGEISELQDKKALCAFYQRHADGLYLNQHRHAGYDSMRKNPFPLIKENILTALQSKCLEINADSNSPLTKKEQENLDTERLKLKTILLHKQETLTKQNRGITFSLFYSTSSTDKKLNTLGEALKRLETIANFSELKLFTECLLLDNALIAHRSFGITASDTYLKLKEFNDNCFLDSNNDENSNKPKQAL